MQCTMCGREITNPNANYCDYCGTSVRDGGYREVQPEQSVKTAEAPMADRVSTWLFLGVMCLPFVPFVGTFAYLGILFYWAFASSIKDSRKSFARATLIYTAVAFVFVFAILGAMASSMMATLTSVPGM